MLDVAIIGAGASGLMCACRLISAGITNIAVYERNDRPGKKLLATGNGRCNLSNSSVKPEDYNTDDSDKLAIILDRYGYDQTAEYFEKTLNVMLASKDELIYPRTFKSSTVLDALRNYIEDHGVKIITDSFVDSIKDEAKYTVIASGGMAMPVSGSDGNSYKLINSVIKDKTAFCDVRPSLVQFTSSDRDIKTLSGIRVNAVLSLYINKEKVAEEAGELLFTDYGISGICTMQLSRIYDRYIAKGIKSCYVSADLVSEYDKDALDEEVKRRITDGKDIASRLSGILQKEICEVITSRGRDIAGLMKEFKINITGTRDFEHAQVTFGGLKLGRLIDTLSIKEHDDVYVIGEAVNVDGPCGGYNLQWAWSSAFAAADDISVRLG